MDLREFRKMLCDVDRSYEWFVSLVISFIRMSENNDKAALISDFIQTNPTANSSDVIEYMINELGLSSNVAGPLVNMA